MLIQESQFDKETLLGKVVLITGAGGGIGFEAARALAYLGADVIIAEINKDKGLMAQNTINSMLDSDRVSFFHVDIANEKQIDDLFSFVVEKYGFLDVLFNNATITPMGAVDNVSIADWDKSYAVNLRAPVLLTQKFLPLMKQRNSGVIVFVPSSGAAPYMGAYEIFKTAQVELSNTLSGELENTDIITYSIGPGLVKTETAQKAIETVSSLMGMTLKEFYEINEKHILDAEMAGVGFALSVVNAKRYRGQEIGSTHALMDENMLKSERQIVHSAPLSEDTESLYLHVKNIVEVFNEQYDGWLQKNIFERQWVLRDFKKTVGLSADSFQLLMSSVLDSTDKKRIDMVVDNKPQFEKLQKYYIRLHKFMQGYEKNPDELKKNSLIIHDWINELQTVIDML